MGENPLQANTYESMLKHTRNDSKHIRYSWKFKRRTGQIPHNYLPREPESEIYSKTIMNETMLAHNALVSETELHNMGKQSWITTM